MRIIGGSLRSRKFEAPPGISTRPTADRAKVALFNILGHRLAGARVLDGFAGSGALSFEALSRGAQSAVLFEADAKTAALIRWNAEALGVAGQADVRSMDFLAGAAMLAGREFDVVFLDPPYSAGLLERAIGVSEPALASGGIIAAEHGAEQEMPQTVGSLVKSDSRKYGAIAFSFYTRQANG